MQIQMLKARLSIRSPLATPSAQKNRPNRNRPRFHPNRKISGDRRRSRLQVFHQLLPASRMTRVRAPGIPLIILKTFYAVLVTRRLPTLPTAIFLCASDSWSCFLALLFCSSTRLKIPASRLSSVSWELPLVAWSCWCSAGSYASARQSTDCYCRVAASELSISRYSLRSGLLICCHHR